MEVGEAPSPARAPLRLRRARLVGTALGRLTLLVLDRALADCARWRPDHPLPVAVNPSPSSLADPRLASDVQRALAAHGLPGSALLVEITEDALADDPERARSVLAALPAQDVALAIDDYGAGYSSLAHLRDLRVDELKLDRSFVTGLAGDPVRCAIVGATLDLARGLGLRMVAEGVESASDWEQLAAMGCDLAQGFHVSRPLPLPDLLAWLDGRAVDRAA